MIARPRRFTARASARACLVAAALAGSTVAADPLHAQSPRPATRPAPASRPPVSSTSTPADAANRDARAARTALERGDAAKAIALVEPVLAKQPGHPLAAAVKVDALLGLGERTRALDAYDAWYAAVKLEDTAMIARIAVAELDALQADPLLQVDALAALSARPGGPGTAARAKLTELATAKPATARAWPATVALAQLGDRTAAGRAAQAYRDSVGSGRVTALEAVISAGGAAAEPILRDALGVRDAMVQSTAADGAATLGLKSLVPALQEVAKTGELFARFSAAVALAHLGATGGETLLAAGETSAALDMRLRAAGARKARGDRAWIEVVRPLLTADDVVVRSQAAAMLRDVDGPASLKVLQAGTMDPNPAVRTLVADVVTKDPATPVAELRRLLRDGVPRVRLLAAAAIVRRPPPPR